MQLAIAPGALVVPVCFGFGFGSALGFGFGCGSARNHNRDLAAIPISNCPLPDIQDHKMPGQRRLLIASRSTRQRRQLKAQIKKKKHKQKPKNETKL